MTIKPATPLPWVVVQHNIDHPHAEPDSFRPADIYASGLKVRICRVSDRMPNDAAYIVEACNAHPRLLDENKRLKDALREARDALLLAFADEDAAIADNVLSELGEL